MPEVLIKVIRWQFGQRTTRSGSLVNFLLIEALERYHHFFQSFSNRVPLRVSGRILNHRQFKPGFGSASHPVVSGTPWNTSRCHGTCPRFTHDPHWRDLVYFHEYFHGDDGRGLGATHQTGWTALIAKSNSRPPARDRTA